MKSYSQWKYVSFTSRKFNFNFVNILKRKNYHLKTKSLLKNIFEKRNRIFKTIFGRVIFEKQRFKSFYGISKEKEFRLLVKKIGSVNFLSIFESRLDIFIYRLGFFGSLQFIRQYIRCNCVYINGIAESNFRRFLVPGDVVSFDWDFFFKLVKDIQKVSNYFRRFNFFSYIEFSPIIGSFVFYRYPKKSELSFPFKYSSSWASDFYRLFLKLFGLKLTLL